MQEAEQMGTRGHVEEAQGLMKLCDQLKEERDTLRKQNESIHWSQVINFLELSTVLRIAFHAICLYLILCVLL